MLVWYLRKILHVSRSVSDTLILTTLKTSTSTGQQWDMCLHYPKQVSWHSSLQFTVTFSVVEAEYMAMTKAMRETIWLQELLDDLGIDQDLLKINCDSISAIYLAKK